MFYVIGSRDLLHKPFSIRIVVVISFFTITDSVHNLCSSMPTDIYVGGVRGHIYNYIFTMPYGILTSYNGPDA